MDAEAAESGSRFLASTLHEVRTPVQTIISTVELLQETELDEEQTEYLHQIKFSAETLLQLANNVLDSAKIRAGKLSLENIPYDAVALCERVACSVCADSFARGIEVVTRVGAGVPCEVMGDPARVQQVLMNLVKNAAKFTDGGSICVALHLVGGAYVRFEVADTGIGIDKEKIPLLFQDFYQGDSSITRKYGGSGLGLSISRALVECMGGRIGVRQNEGGGSVFWFELPYAAVPGAERSAKNVPQGTRALVVSSNALCACTVAEKLAVWGVEGSVIAGCVETALECMRHAAQEQRPFTLAFIDMHVGHTEGWHLASLINADHSINGTRLYLMLPEGHVGGEVKMNLLRWFNGCIHKPVRFSRLGSILDQMSELPMELSPAEGLPEPVKQRSVPGAKSVGKILVAEDHPVNQKLLRTMISRLGVDVTCADDGQQAVEAVLADPAINMVFMDIQMPVKSGLDATMELRARNYTGIIVACTANSDSVDLEAYRAAGMNDVLVKPFFQDSVRSMIEKWGELLNMPAPQNIMAVSKVYGAYSGAEWDLHEFMRSCGGDEGLARELVGDFTLQTEKLFAELNELVQVAGNAAGSADLIAKKAHAVKGSAAAMCATKLRDAAAAMDYAARDGNVAKAGAMLTNCTLEFKNVRAIMEKWRNSITT